MELIVSKVNNTTKSKKSSTLQLVNVFKNHFENDFVNTKVNNTTKSKKSSTLQLVNDINDVNVFISHSENDLENVFVNDFVNKPPKLKFKFKVMKLRSRLLPCRTPSGGGGAP